jgi:hypothetical protein
MWLIGQCEFLDDLEGVEVHGCADFGSALL